MASVIMRMAGIKSNPNNPKKRSTGEFARLEAKIRKTGRARDPAALTAFILRRAGRL